MLNRWKRLLALLASVAVLFSLCTAASAAPDEQAEPRELTEADYAAADAIFASLPSADGTNGGAAGAGRHRALCNWLETADGVRPGTVSANGSCVTWQTDAASPARITRSWHASASVRRNRRRRKRWKAFPPCAACSTGATCISSSRTTVWTAHSRASTTKRASASPRSPRARSTIIRRRPRRSTPLPTRSSPAALSCLTATAPRIIPATMRTTPPKRRRPTSACRAARA